MSQSAFHDEMSLGDAAEDLAKQAIQLGLIETFVVRHYRDTKQFYVPDEHQEPLTPEEAYLHFKQLIGKTA